MIRRRPLVWLLSLGIPVIAVVVVAVAWGWNLLIPLVEAKASAALGRPVTIAQLHVSPGRITRITADDVVVGNPADWHGEPLAKIPHLTVDADVWTYLRHGELVVPLIDVNQPLILATQTPNGAANYLLEPPGGSGPGARIGEVRIEDGRARIRLAKLQADFELAIAMRESDGKPQIVVETKGTYAAQPITGRLIGGGLLGLSDPAHPWPVDLRIQNGPTLVTLAGTMVNPLALDGTSLQLRLAGPDMSRLEPLVGFPIPRTPNYEVSGQLDFADRQIRFRDFKGRVGSSDLSGTIAVDPGKARPEVTANLASRSVDLADLGGFIGITPGRMGTPGQSAAEHAEVARAEASPKLLPTARISVPKLQWADIHLKYLGQRIVGRSVPLDQLAVALDIVNGQVTLHPVSFSVGSGRINGNIVLTPEQDAVRAKAEVQFQRVDLARLMAATQTFKGAGTISGTAELDGTGASLAQILGTGNGRVRLGMAGGDLSAMLVDLSGLQFGNALLSALGLPDRTTVECFVGDLALRGGVLSIQALVLDTGSDIVEGAGQASLLNETLAMRLRTDSKHFSIGSLPAPINIKGTLKSPSILPGAELVARGGAAAGLGVVFPPLALLPTIQFGVGDDHRCESLLSTARRPATGQRPAPANRSTSR